MKLLLEFKADPKIATNFGDTALTAAGGVGWVPGVTYERSVKENVEAIRMLLDLGLDPNGANQDGRTALMGAAMKGATRPCSCSFSAGPTSRNKITAVVTPTRRPPRQPATAGRRSTTPDGLVRVGVQSAVEYPETSALIRKMMEERGIPTPPKGRNILSSASCPALRRQQLTNRPTRRESICEQGQAKRAVEADLRSRLFLRHPMVLEPKPFG
jgi:hypothetical protein